MINLANQNRFISFTVSCLSAIIPLSMLGNGIALGQTRSVTVLTAADLATFRSQILTGQNTLRVTHQVSTFTTDSALAAGAQAWAENMAKTGTFAHASSTELNGAGENIFKLSTTASTYAPDALAKQAVTDSTRSWYKELQYYDFSNPGMSNTPGQAIGHFTQLVWKASTSVGCGTASSLNPTPYVSGGNSYMMYEYYVVCRYSPAGNLAGAYADNVKPAK